MPGLVIKSTWTGNQTCNLGMCPDQELNLQPFGYKTTLQPTEPHWPGLNLFFKYSSPHFYHQINTSCDDQSSELQSLPQH